VEGPPFRDEARPLDCDDAEDLADMAVEGRASREEDDCCEDDRTLAAGLRGAPAREDDLRGRSGTGGGGPMGDGAGGGEEGWLELEILRAVCGGGPKVPLVAVSGVTGSAEGGTGVVVSGSSSVDATKPRPRITSLRAPGEPEARASLLALTRLSPTVSFRPRGRCSDDRVVELDAVDVGGSSGNWSDVALIGSGG
jgi:hypothetical protein